MRLAAGLLLAITLVRCFWYEPPVADSLGAAVACWTEVQA